MILLRIDCPKCKAKYAVQTIEKIIWEDKFDEAGRVKHQQIDSTKVTLDCINSTCDHSWHEELRDYELIPSLIKETLERAISQYLGGISDDDENRFHMWGEKYLKRETKAQDIMQRITQEMMERQNSAVGKAAFDACRYFGCEPEELAVSYSNDGRGATIYGPRSVFTRLEFSIEKKLKR